MSEVILAASACRTSITETIQSASTLPGAGSWGCEIASGSGSKYVQQVVTKDDGTVLVTAQGIDATNIDGKVVSLRPLNSSNATPGAGTAVTQWRCGNASDGTTLNTKWLPGSCKG
jgi:type IV pilus assembly protein PilA